MVILAILVVLNQRDIQIIRQHTSCVTQIYASCRISTKNQSGSSITSGGIAIHAEPEDVDSTGFIHRCDLV